MPEQASGGIAGGEVVRVVGLRKLGERAAAYQIVQLPSSSPAHTLAYADKLSQWLPLSACLERPGDSRTPNRRA